MTSKIPSLELDVPTKLITVTDFQVSGDPPSPFPPDFLPDDTKINIKLEEGGGVYTLLWTNGEGSPRSIQGLTWSQSQGLNGKNVKITIGDVQTVFADVTIVPRSLEISFWDGAICFICGQENKRYRRTPTTGTFVAQASPDGGFKLDCVPAVGGRSKDTFPQLGTSNPGA
jgi:hypothetical protein